MSGIDRAPREGEAGSFERGSFEAGHLEAGRRDWLWAVGLLAALAGLSWIFDLALRLF